MRSFITYFKCSKFANEGMTGATSRAGFAYPSGAPEFTPPPRF